MTRLNLSRNKCDNDDKYKNKYSPNAEIISSTTNYFQPTHPALETYPVLKTFERNFIKRNKNENRIQ